MKDGTPYPFALGPIDNGYKLKIMAQQTAVEWLFDQIPLEWTIKGSAKKIFEQAKQMEKKQILDAICANQNGLLRRKTVLEAMEYYKETFGGQGSPDTSNIKNK